MTDREINKWVTKHHFLIEAGYNMTLAEQRVVIAGLSQIDSLRDTPESLKDLEFVINANDFCAQFSLPLDNGYKELKAACKRLATNALTIYDPNNKDGYDYLTSAMGSFEWSSQSRKVRITWHPKMFPYICQLRGQFHSYMSDTVSKFKSQHSLRLFELLIQWETTGFREVQIDWLRERFQLENKYSAVKDLRKWVIEPAMKDINKFSNISVKMGVRKRGNKIIAFQFNFGAKAEQPEPKKIELGELVQGVPRKLLESLARPGETETQAANRIKSLRLAKESWQSFKKRIDSKGVDVKTQDMFPDLL